MSLLHFSVIRIWCARLVIHPVPPRYLWNPFHFHKGKLWGSWLCVDVSEWFQHKWDEREGEQQWVGTGAFLILETERIIILLQRPKALVRARQRKALLSPCQWFLSSGTTAACVGTWDVFLGFIKPVMSLLPCNKCSCCLQTVPGTISSIATKITPLTECVLLLCQSFPKEKPEISLKSLSGHWALKRPQVDPKCALLL